jgi:Flp pilus assembly protein TadG
MLETALVLLPCLVLIMGLIEYSRYMMIRQLSINAVRQGARMALNSKYTATTSDITAFVMQQLAAQGPSDIQVSVYKADPSGANIGAWTSAYCGDTIAVKIDANYVPLVPTFGILNNPMPMSIVASMYCEVN